VITEDTKEIAEDVDEVTVEALIHQSAGRSTCLVRLGAESGVVVGDRISLRIDARRLHVFDLDTGERVAGPGGAASATAAAQAYISAFRRQSRTHEWERLS